MTVSRTGGENDDDEQLFMKEGFDAAGLFDVVAQLKNGDVLLDWLQQNTTALPDLILSDLNMPGMGGMQCLRELKARAPSGAPEPAVRRTSGGGRGTG